MADYTGFIANGLYRAWSSRSQARIKTAAALLPTPGAGHVYTIGVGKSRYLAERLAGVLRTVTLNSSFLHPSEALHGEISTVNPGDAVIFVSASGESPELVDLATLPHSAGASRILVTTSETSTLSALCQVTIWPGFEPVEYSLFPGVSAALMLIAGDALCAEVVELRGVRARDVVPGHPRGTFFCGTDTSQQGEQ